MSRKNRSLAVKAERAKRERRAFATDQGFRAMLHDASRACEVVMVKAEHVGWRNTVRRMTIDTSRKSIVATHW